MSIWNTLHLISCIVIGTTYLATIFIVVSLPRLYTAFVINILPLKFLSPGGDLLRRFGTKYFI